MGMGRWGEGIREIREGKNSNKKKCVVCFININWQYKHSIGMA